MSTTQEADKESETVQKSTAQENMSDSGDEKTSGDEEKPQATHGTGVSGEATPGQEPPMSKRKQKRLARNLKKKGYLKEKRVRERIAKKERRKELREQGLPLGPTRKSLKHNTMERSACKVTAVIDCSFDDLMMEKDIKSLSKQINFCYAANRRVEDPLQFHCTSFCKQVKKTMDDIGDHKNWNMFTHEEGYEQVFSKERLVYLSSDSPNILTELEQDKVYIIGGLVDHNHHKGLCLKLAEEKGLAHAQLPIEQYISMETRKVLAINHVFEILLQYTQTKDWKESFYQVIPRRKRLNDKEEETNESSKSGDQEGTSGPTMVGSSSDAQSKGDNCDNANSSKTKESVGVDVGSNEQNCSEHNDDKLEGVTRITNQVTSTLEGKASDMDQLIKQQEETRGTKRKLSNSEECTEIKTEKVCDNKETNNEIAQSQKSSVKMDINNGAAISNQENINR